MILVFLLACASEGPWTREAVLMPALTRLDKDGDGRLIEPEWGRVSWNGGTLQQVDLDHSGALELGELDTILQTQDPTRRNNPVERGQSKSGSKTEAHGEAWLLLHLLRDEITAKDPTAPVPNDAAILAADAGGVEGPDAHALLVQLRTTSTRLGLAFPVGLGE